MICPLRALPVVFAAISWACASAPAMVVTEDELASLVRDLRATSGGSGSEDVRVSEIRVKGHAIVVRLRGESKGNGWRRWATRSCRREGKRGPWRCFAPSGRTEAWLPEAPSAIVMGLEGRDAVRILRFLEGEKGQLLPAASKIECVASLGDGNLAAEYGGTIHHAQTSVGRVYLKASGDSFVIARHLPTPDWFDGPPEPTSLCAESRTELERGEGTPEG